MLNFAIETAREAGQILLEKFGRKINVSKKGDINLVTEADLASEKLIIEKIKSYYPKHSILAEESGDAVILGGDNKWKWIIDPLDGTTNYAHGYPCFCVTIALEHDGEIVIGVTFDPTRNETFCRRKRKRRNFQQQTDSRFRYRKTWRIADRYRFSLRFQTKRKFRPAFDRFFA